MPDRRRDRLDALADAADPSGGGLSREERHVRPDARQLNQLLRVGAGRHATGCAPEPPGRRRVRRSAAEPGRRRDPLLEGEADEVRLLAEAGPESAPCEVPGVDWHVAANVALDAQPAAPRKQQEPIGQLEQDELAVEEVQAIVATSDDLEREVELRRGLEPERRHSEPPNAAARQAHSRMFSVCGRRSPSTPHRSRATATSSREAGSSRIRPLWICLRRWRNPACTTR